jgi:predicted acyl esterase
VYRDIWFQGGIPETSFAPGWLKGIQNGRNETEDLIRMRKEHPLLDDLWKIREVDLSAIDVPAFIVFSWKI